MLGNSKKVPMDSFGGLANQKKSYANSESSYSGTSNSSGSGSDSDSDEDEDDGLSSIFLHLEEINNKECCISMQHRM